jgi:two-component system, NarL family, nitrate/nitrite response regulator NarL
MVVEPEFAADHEHSAFAPSGAAFAMRSKPITVIVVDDEERIRRFARLILESDKKVRVVGEADNGRSATALARELCPDVIVMDISMPVMNGLDAAKTILRDCPKTRIIMTTAMGGEPYRQVSLSLGAAGFVDKSCLDSELIETVHKTAKHGPH